MFKKIIAKHDFKSGKAKVVIGTSLRQRGFIENGQIQIPFEEPNQTNTLFINGNDGGMAITVNDLQTTISNLTVTGSAELPNYQGRVKFDEDSGYLVTWNGEQWVPLHETSYGKTKPLWKRFLSWFNVI